MSDRERDRVATIVMYHVIRPSSGVASALKGIDADEFRGQLAYIQAHYSVVPILAIADAVEAGGALPDRPAVLTFDDGYAGHYREAYRALREARVSGAFFPVAASALDGQVLDVNRIQLILAASPDADALVARIERTVDEHVAGGGPTRESYRRQWWGPSRWDVAPVAYVKRMLQYALPESSRRPLVDDLFRRLVSADERSIAAELYMSPEQIREMRDGGMTIGAHGGRHVRLSTLTPPAQAAEIDDGLRVLDAAGTPRHGFAYCYANGDHDDTSVAILRERGCRIAVTTQPGLARTAAAALLTLPRLDTNALPRQADAAPVEWTRRAAELVP
jgi:peptidoglycan/xylan/chitin deacetylase (PgdA/CDA1 family)